MKWAVCAAILFAAPVFAQSSGATFALDRSSVTSVHEYVATAAVPTQLALPSNLVTAEIYRPVLDVMLQHSPTFRRQCLRIATERHLTVTVNLAVPASTSHLRAQTRILRQPDGRVAAAITIFPLSDAVELIAHEIEHVIEQMDGIDLTSRSALPDSGVRTVGRDPHTFETTRATRTGLKVASEVYR